MSSTVPAFLTKLWTLVEDPSVDYLICWDESGSSFHVYDQGRFAKEILPHYFKHSNIASFIRQLNMYGFKKVSHIEHGIKDEADDLEFQHPYFQRGQEHLMEKIKRKIAGGSTHIKTEPFQEIQQAEISKVINEVQIMKSKQETVSTKLISMKRENELLWREVASLRQKHSKQQQIVNKLIQFLIHLVGGRSGMGVNLNRKRPLMLSDSSNQVVPPPKLKKYSKTDLPVYSVQSPESTNVDNNLHVVNSGPVISELLDTDSLISDPKPTVAVSPAGNQQGDMTRTNPVYTAEPVNKLDLSTNDWKLPSDLLSPGVLENYDLKDFPSELTINPLTNNISSVSGNPTLDTNYLSGLLPSNNGDGSQDKSVQQKKKNPPGLSRQQSIHELNDHVDSVQYDLEGLRDILQNSQYNLDPEFLLGLFKTDSSLHDPENVVNIMDPDHFKNEEEDQSNSLNNSGSELVQYKPTDVLPDLFDLADLSKDEEPDIGALGIPVDSLSSSQHVPADELD